MIKTNTPKFWKSPDKVATAINKANTVLCRKYKRSMFTKKEILDAMYGKGSFKTRIWNDSKVFRFDDIKSVYHEEEQRGVKFYSLPHDMEVTCFDIEHCHKQALQNRLAWDKDLSRRVNRIIQLIDPIRNGDDKQTIAKAKTIEDYNDMIRHLEYLFEENMDVFHDFMYAHGWDCNPVATVDDVKLMLLPLV